MEQPANRLFSTCRSVSMSLVIEGYKHTSMIDIMPLVHAKEGNLARHLMLNGNQLMIRDEKQLCVGIGATDCNDG